MRRHTPISDSYRRIFSQAFPGDPQQRNGYELLGIIMRNECLKGNLGAIKEVSDRIEGRAPAQLDITLEDDRTDVFERLRKLTAKLRALPGETQTIDAEEPSENLRKD